MAPRRPQFTQADIDTQLQQIHLLDHSSSSENLESLAPLIKNIHENHQAEAFLRTTQGLVGSKEAEIERICRDNYQDFVSSVSTLLTVRSYTHDLRERIRTLDTSVSTVGHALATKKKALLQSKKTASNLDEAIDTLEGCLRILHLVNQVGDMIKNGNYWSALKSLEDIESLPQSSLSQTPFFVHLLSSLPSLRAQIKDAVTASNKSWLLEIRNVSGQIGKLALEAMKTRSRRWKIRREKEPHLRLSNVGSPVEMVTNEKVEYDVLNNEDVQVDFKPLYQCIHIHDALDSIEQLQRSYQADRQAQASLILSDRISIASGSRSLAVVLPPLTEDIVGFFIIESHVLRTTRSFRSARDVEQLWETVVSRVIQVVKDGLEDENDVDTFLLCKDIILTFIQTLESYSYETEQIKTLIFILFERYSAQLERKFGAYFDRAVFEDDHLPMQVDTQEDLENVLKTCFLNKNSYESLLRSPVPGNLPFSKMFYHCCSYIRQFVEKFYQFVEGVSHHHRDIDELLRKALDQLLTKHVGANISVWLSKSRNLSQIAQVITTIEYLQASCNEVEEQLMKIRASQSGGSIRLTSLESFNALFNSAVEHLIKTVNLKLTDFFDLAEYDWTPRRPDPQPSLYLWDMVNWLMTAVDGLEKLSDSLKEAAYRGALAHAADTMMDFLSGRDVPAINENGLANLLIDINFLEQEFTKLAQPERVRVFAELRSTIAVVQKDDVSAFMTPAMRAASYKTVQPRKLSNLLEKMARFGLNSRIRSDNDNGEKWRLEAQAVARMAG